MNDERYEKINKKTQANEFTKHFSDNLRQRDIESLWFILKDARGRWFLQRLIDRAGVLSHSFTGNASTYYNEGRRSIGINYIEDVARLGIAGLKYKIKAEEEYMKIKMEIKEIVKKEIERSN